MTEILHKVVSLLNDIKLGGGASRREVVLLDEGVLSVAVLVAALDGEIFPGEYAAFEVLLKACRGSECASAPVTFEKLLAHAERMLVMARDGHSSDEARLDAFRKLAVAALPDGFKGGSMADLRRAFALWQVIAMSDGSVSELERAALQLLLVEFAGVSVENAKPTLLLEADFLAKVEEIVRRLGDAATLEKAKADLLALVTTITLQDGCKRRSHPASRVMVATLFDIAVAMSAMGGGGGLVA